MSEATPPSAPATPPSAPETPALNPGTPPSDADLALLRLQLGREPRGVLAIAARCPAGHPLVVATAPRLPDGSPFPTLYYLTEPHLAAAIGSLEAGGVMAELTARLASDEDLARGYRAAHASYLADREAIAHVPEIAGVSAGGMPTRVKCLHALVGHSLAKGPGVNPIGDIAIGLLAGAWEPGACSCAPLQEG